VTAASVEVVRFEPSHRAAFSALHSDANDAAWCQCVAWWVPTWDGWGERGADDNSSLREELFERGEYDGYLAYAGGTPVGWCQVGPRDRLDKLVRQFGLAPDPGTWAITCFLIRPASRGRGVARALLAVVLDDLPGREARRVEAFPKRGERLDAGELWNGPEAMLRGAGFTVVHDDPVRPVLAKAL
jgi:GNAT superfamily N-acetyltransferase